MGWERLKNKNLQKRLIQRAKIISLTREFFVSKGFLEVETPILVAAAGQEPYLNPMRVQLADKQGYLITSPEYAHKKLLAAGFKKTFELAKTFRAGEPLSGLHNPEFTMLEWYRANADYFAIMEDVERMVKYIFSVIASEAGSHAEGRSASGGQSRRSPRPATLRLRLKAFPAMTILYQGHEIDLSSPWERITVREAFRKYANVHLENVRSDDAFFKIFFTHIERKLGFPKPTILYEYPARMASLARLKKSDPHYAERFELYIAGIELANAFSELNNAKEQQQRFLQEQKLRKKLGKEIIPIDQDFLDALAHMPPAAGIALGIDRLVMLLTNAKTIEDVLTFPANQVF